MTNIFLTSSTADSEVTAGSGTKWKADFTPGGSATHLNKNSVAGPTSPLQATDGAAGTDGTVVSFYTPPLRAVTIASTITCSIWTRENATANNVAPTIRIERTSGDGTVQSTIVSETTSHGAGEMGTTAGGASDTITCSAANVTDTTLSDGDRLRITLWIDDAAGQGGTGNMASGGRGEFWVNGPVGSQGQARLAFTEQVQPLAGPNVVQKAESTRGSTNPQTVTLSSATNGDTIYLLCGGDGGLSTGNNVSAVTASTTAGTTGSWSTVSEQLTTSGENTVWLSIKKASVTATGSVTASVNRTQAGTGRNWHLFGFLVRSSAGDEVATKYTSNATEVVNTAIAAGSTVLAYWADWDAGSVGTPEPNTPTIHENSSDTTYTENVFEFTGQASGTRDYGTTGASGANIRVHALEILAPVTGTNAAAENAAVAAAAGDIDAKVSPTSGNAAVTAAANQAAAKVAPPAGVAAVTAAALDATVTTVGGTVVNAECATVTAAALQPAASIAPTAATAAVTAAANSPAPRVAPAAANSSVAVTAGSPAPAVAPTAGAAGVTASAGSPAAKVAVNAENAPVGVAALQPSTLTGTVASAQVATVGVAANGASLSVRTNPATADVACGVGASGKVGAPAGSAAVAAAALAGLPRVGPAPSAALVAVSAGQTSQKVTTGSELAAVLVAAGQVTMGIPDVLATSAPTAVTARISSSPTVGTSSSSTSAARAGNSSRPAVDDPNTSDPTVTN